MSTDTAAPQQETPTPEVPAAPSAATQVVTGDTTHQIVVFTLGDEEYGLPIGQVQEIISYQQPRTVSSEVDWIRGVISLRGKIIPVCDLVIRLGLTVAEGSEAAGKIVIVEGADSIAGIVVDQVEEVLTVGDAQIEALPVTGSDTTCSIVKVDDRLIVLLDSAAILDGSDVALPA